MLDFDHSILLCPITKESLTIVHKNTLVISDLALANSILHSDSYTSGFVNDSKTFFYPIIEDVIILLSQYALALSSKIKVKEMSFDKTRVFDYYNDINYHTFKNLKVQNDSSKWIDYRDVSSDYIIQSLSNTKQYIPDNGKYFLDIASGTVGFKEYVELSNGYQTRICIDLSLQALLLAKDNMRGHDTIFICGDITNIPLKSNICDVVVSHHTLYHVPKKEQKTAVEEMYRVTKPNSKVIIVYSFFYHSLLMNLTLFPVQVYRVARHFAGKIYVRITKSKPRLYFYPHSRRWFKSQFKFSNQIQILSWRSVNKYFLDIYIHKSFMGEKILKWLLRSEKKYPKFWGRIGEYASIVVEKKP